MLRLMGESKDFEVLRSCANCLIKASSANENCRLLLDKNIFSGIGVLVELHDDHMKHLTAVTVANLSTSIGLEDMLILHGVLTILQHLLSHIHRSDTLCFCLLSLSNIGPAIAGPDAELTMRMCFQGTQKIDVNRFFSKAIFISDLYTNFSRLNQFSSLLVEEGVMPLLLHMIDIHQVDDILRKGTEALANLSMNRKNRREIASSGIAARLPLLFEKGSSATRASALLIMGNLLSSGLFHDKVATPVTINNILENLMDINHQNQFNAVAYCLCQLSKTESSCSVMVSCGVVPLVLSYLRTAPKASLDYLWNVLVNVSSYPVFFPFLMNEKQALLDELYEEVRFDASTPAQQQSVVQIGLNISLEGQLSDYLDQALIDTFVRTMKILFLSRTAKKDIQRGCLMTLINFNYYCKEARGSTLSGDLLESFYDVGLEDDQINVKYAALLNIISTEESCCYKLLDLGAQKFIVSLQDSFTRLTNGALNVQNKKKKALKKGMSMANITALINETRVGTTDDEKEKDSSTVMDAEDNETSLEGEMGRAFSAATLHNLSLKRQVLAPGVLITLLSLSKNCKTLRVLHCTRMMANLSTHPKAKAALSKEARRLIPLMTVIMRCGCEEAERVQHYCSITLCNILATPLDKMLLMDLIKTGAITDLVVVTLLRINSTVTKESLGKAFFNLLTRAELREELLMKLDMLSAIIELSKIEFVDLLELCMRCIYNITCDLATGPDLEESYSFKLLQHKVPRLLIGRLVYNPNQTGSMTTRPIRLLLAKSIANMSFNKKLVVEFTSERGKIADALHRVHKLGSDEATYCASATLFNLSQIPECTVLADSKALPLIVDILDGQCTVICMKLCMAALCNFSLHGSFHEYISDTAIPTLVRLIGLPHIHMSIKKDALQTVYNIVTLHHPARNVFVESEGVVALWKLLKVQGGAAAPDPKAGDPTAPPVETEGEEDGTDADLVEEDSTLLILGHIVKALTDADMSEGKYQKQLMNDGIMSIILKLSKYELPILKVDMSFSIYSMTRGPDSMKVLKSDTVDILFWLTLYDTLSLHDLILRNVARCLRSFSHSRDEASLVVRQERFFTVLKTLLKSKHEDVLWQTAGTLYNLMHETEYSLRTLLERGLVTFIFEIAASGFESVKHVCSACLHMIPDNLPNMEDPLVLELVLCLLEAEGDKFSELGEKPVDIMSYTVVESRYAGSLLQHKNTDFKASWSVLTCYVDTIFSPSLLATPSESNLEFTVPSLDAGSISAMTEHEKLQPTEYNNFYRENRRSSADEVLPGLPGLSVTQTGTQHSLLFSEEDDYPQGPVGRHPFENPHVVTPSLQAKAPPAYDCTSPMISPRSEFSTASHSKRMSGYQQGVSLTKSASDGVVPTGTGALPLLRATEKIPEDSVDAINRSIYKAAGKPSHSQSQQLLLSKSLVAPLGGTSGSLEEALAANGVKKKSKKLKPPPATAISFNKHGIS